MDKLTGKELFRIIIESLEEERLRQYIEDNEYDSRLMTGIIIVENIQELMKERTENRLNQL